MFSRCLMSQVKHNSYFIIGLFLGLWVSIAVIPLDDDIEPCIASSTSAAVDEFEPHREERPANVASPVGSRNVQRPRYFSTELGIRDLLFSAILTTEDGLDDRGRAINKTSTELLPSLRFFITAKSASSAIGKSNVVGFTDTREVLKPFHVLKYLADNYLEEYNFFFISSDTSYVNSLKLKDMVSKLSISQDVYMGIPAEDDSHYCSLENGILLSNSVLRQVHLSLDWCVRNSYSGQHHENLGRCILHAAKKSCTSRLQGQNYKSTTLINNSIQGMLTSELADSVTVGPISGSNEFYQLHSYVSRIHLEKVEELIQELHIAMRKSRRRHPIGFRNETWPVGLRTDPGLLPPPPDTRFDYLRWTLFNSSHALFPNDHYAILPLTGANKKAVDLAVTMAIKWAQKQWPEVEGITLRSGAWLWQPATSLQYRLLLIGSNHWTRQLEVTRILGAARLVTVPYVTESARISVILVTKTPSRAKKFLDSYKSRADSNTDLVMVLVHPYNQTEAQFTNIKTAIQTLASERRDSNVHVLETNEPIRVSETMLQLSERVTRIGLKMALQRVNKDALLLLAIDIMDFNVDFLNRVRMNTIQDVQWFSPIPFARFSQYNHPLFVDGNGNKPQQNTGRFDSGQTGILSVYRRDLEDALHDQSISLETTTVPLTTVLAKANLHCIRAPEPGIVLEPQGPPCPQNDLQCLKELEEVDFKGLNFGAKHSLAKLLLEVSEGL